MLKLKDNLTKNSKNTVSRLELLKLNNPSVENNKFILFLYNTIKKIYKNPVGSLTIESEVFFIDKWMSLLDKKFIDKTITKSIKKNIKSQHCITYKNNTIYIFSCKEYGYKFDRALLDKILYVLLFMKKLFNNRSANTIYIFLSPNKKLFPKPNIVIGPRNCNSGLTFYSGLDNGTIIIFREEEIIKVLIHELIHALRGDSLLWSNSSNNKIYEKFCLLNKNININETYTEFLASLIHQIYIIVVSNVSIKRINDMISIETEYSLGKINQIMKHNGYKNFNELYRKDRCKIFLQDTNVFSYYILKTALFTNIDKTLKYFEDCTTRCKINNEYCRDSFILLVLSSINNHFNTRLVNSRYRCRSLRMTLFELK